MISKRGEGGGSLKKFFFLDSYQYEQSIFHQGKSIKPGLQHRIKTMYVVKTDAGMLIFLLIFIHISKGFVSKLQWFKKEIKIKYLSSGCICIFTSSTILKNVAFNPQVYLLCAKIVFS